MAGIADLLWRTGLFKPAKRSYLYKAIMKGDAKWVDAILAKHPDAANATMGSGMKPIHVAASVGNAAVTQALLNHGASARAKTDDGDSPTRIAKNMGNTGVEYVLRKHRAKTRAAKQKSQEDGESEE